MPLHLTKIAYGAQTYSDIARWFENRPHLAINTRYRPTRWAECVGGSLYWIHEHNLVARCAILDFREQEDGRWWIDLDAQLIPVVPLPKRAHQGWRYLKGEPPRDLAEGEDAGDLIPRRLAGKLAQLGLI